MKRILLSTIFLLSVCFVQAQETVPDQNPNHKTAQAKYVAAQDKLQETMNTTVQNTYKAYDWYEAKQERRQQRITFRQDRRMARINNQGNFRNNWNGMPYYGHPSMRNNYSWFW